MGGSLVERERERERSRERERVPQSDNLKSKYKTCNYKKPHLSTKLAPELSHELTDKRKWKH